MDSDLVLAVLGGGLMGSLFFFFKEFMYFVILGRRFVGFFFMSVNLFSVLVTEMQSGCHTYIKPVWVDCAGHTALGNYLKSRTELYFTNHLRKL